MIISIINFKDYPICIYIFYFVRDICIIHFAKQKEINAICPSFTTNLVNTIITIIILWEQWLFQISSNSFVFIVFCSCFLSRILAHEANVNAHIQTQAYFVRSLPLLDAIFLAPAR